MGWRSRLRLLRILRPVPRGDRPRSGVGVRSHLVHAQSHIRPDLEPLAGCRRSSLAEFRDGRRPGHGQGPGEAATRASGDNPLAGCNTMSQRSSGAFHCASRRTAPAYGDSNTRDRDHRPSPPRWTRQRELPGQSLSSGFNLVRVPSCHGRRNPSCSLPVAVLVASDRALRGAALEHEHGTPLTTASARTHARTGPRRDPAAPSRDRDSGASGDGSTSTDAAETSTAGMAAGSDTAGDVTGPLDLSLGSVPSERGWTPPRGPRFSVRVASPSSSHVSAKGSRKATATTAPTTPTA